MVILFLISLVSIITGIFLILRPELCIKIQCRFYEKINWRMEPISMQKEIRNTKFMGLSLVLTGILTIIASVLI